jgi:hypothetical protein
MDFNEISNRYYWNFVEVYKKEAMMSRYHKKYALVGAFFVLIILLFDQLGWIKIPDLSEDNPSMKTISTEILR